VQHKKVFPSYNVARFFSSENSDPLVFCHFTENIQDKNYEMVSTMDKMNGVLVAALNEYNETNAAMDLG
jgi:dynein heavy chain